jgi:hypothetical protein
MSKISDRPEFDTDAKKAAAEKGYALGQLLGEMIKLAPKEKQGDFLLETTKQIDNLYDKSLNARQSAILGKEEENKTGEGYEDAFKAFLRHLYR